MISLMMNVLVAATLYMVAVTGSTFAADQPEITLKEVTKESEKAEIFVQLGHNEHVNALAFSPDGRTIVSCSDDSTLKLWDVATGRELRTLSGHSGRVAAAVFSPDGRTIVSGGLDSSLKLWDVASGRELRTMNGHHKGVSAVAYSPDGRTIASGDWDNTLKLWDVVSGQELRTLQGHSYAPITTVAFSSDGRTLFSGDHSTSSLKLWDVASGQELRTANGVHSMASVEALSPDGRTIASMGISGGDLKEEDISDLAMSPSMDFSNDLSKDRSPVVYSLILWDFASGRILQTLSGYSGGVVAFSPDSHTIVAVNDDHKTLMLWDVASGRELRTLDGFGVSAVAFSPDGHTIVLGGFSGGDYTLKLLDATSGQEFRTLSGQRSGVNAAAFSPDGRIFISGLDNKNFNLILWDAATGQELRTLSGHRNTVTAAAFSPDGRTLVSGSVDKTLKIWNVASGQELRTLSGHGSLIRAVAFSPDGRTIVSGGGNIKELGKYDEREHRYLDVPCNGDCTLKLWDAASGHELRSMSGHSDQVTKAVFSPDGRTIVSGSIDRTIKFWDVATGRELRTLSEPKSLTVRGETRPLSIPRGGGINAIAFSPDGRTLVTGSDTLLKLWDASSGREQKTLSDDGIIDVAVPKIAHYMGDGAIIDAVFSPDGHFIVSSSIDHTIKLWDVASGRELRTLSGNDSFTRTVSFSPDGKRIISGSNDGAVRQWDVKTGKEIARFVSFKDGEWITITPEGYYSSSLNGHKHLNVRMGSKVYGIEQFYDVFYRPDIVQAKLGGEDISSLITLTIDDAIKSPPPSVEFTVTPQNTSQPKAKVCYKATSTGGGIGEVRLFQNGKLVKSDGFYREMVAKETAVNMKLASQDSATIQRDLRNLKVVQNTTSPIVSNDKGNEFEECQELETMPGENEIGVVAFNAPNTIQSTLETVSFKSDRKPEEPNLYILGIGIDHYRDPSVTLQFAAKDANDFRTMMQKKVESLYKPQNIHIEGLSDATATKESIQKTIQNFSKQVKPWDSFILFVASHGVLLENQYYIVTAGYDGKLDRANLISSNEIVGMSKSIKSLSQLFIFDTCHAGGVDNIVSALYDARMSVMAKKMGLHIYASAGSTQTAIDGYEGNGLFTHSLLKSMKEGKAADGKQIGVVELGQQAREETIKISSKMGAQQSPNIINFGKDYSLFMVR